VQFVYPAKILLDAIVHNTFPKWHQYIRKDRIENKQSVVGSQNYHRHSVKNSAHEVNASHNESDSGTETAVMVIVS
jgi:hypothetical protein